jgi:hypothetical protein
MDFDNVDVDNVGADDNVDDVENADDVDDVSNVAVDVNNVGVDDNVDDDDNDVRLVRGHERESDIKNLSDVILNE